MSATPMADAVAPPLPTARLALGITGHRVGHPGYGDQAAGVADALARLFAMINEAVADLPDIWGKNGIAPVRLHSLLANGTDQVAAEFALAHGWDLVAPLPFGRRLNEAINAQPASVADARRLIAGDMPADAEAATQVAAIRALTDRARIFELADRDAAIADLLLARLAAPHDRAAAQLCAAEISARVAQAARIMIEQSDIIVGVWDGLTTAHVGGTGHTIAAALAAGAPVIWMDPSQPDAWRVLRAPEALAGRHLPSNGDAPTALRNLVETAMLPGDTLHPGFRTLEREHWHKTSSCLTHAYRRIETLFGAPTLAGRFANLRQHYPHPDGSDAAPDQTSAIADNEPAFTECVRQGVLRRFYWADGVSARLSDAYRGSMIVNFLLSSLAIVGGVAYLPFVGPGGKWGFAVFELVLLCGILVITWTGRRQRWHGRWFETRRLAEYLRHAPVLLQLGAARAPGRWPRGSETSWPEYYVRHLLRDVGLPRAAMTQAYLRTVLTGMLDAHVTSQLHYHEGKAKRLAAVHRNLDRCSNLLFMTAVATVALYLILRGAAALALIDMETINHSAKLFTVLGVLFPTFGAGVAGIRYFGDFERFAAISDVTANKLDSVHARIMQLAEAPDRELLYDRVAELAHATDDIVFAEIENWQAVFGGKHMTVPI